MSVREEPWLPAAAAGFFVAALAWHASMASVGWTHAISDLHGWRQAQTAITAYFIQQGGPWIAYETPVLGPPWRIPHEFPVYQLVVVGVARLTGLSLESAGRATSLGFFYSTLAATFLLLAELGIGFWHRLLVLGVWLLSPLYIFWSRTFMVESTALCLSVWYLLFLGLFLKHTRTRDAVLAAVTGVLAAAVKPITVVPFVALAGVWCLVAARWRWRAMAVVAALLVVLPLFGGWLWQRHADSLKGLDSNPLAWGISSKQLFQDWILGPRGGWAGPEKRLVWGYWAPLFQYKLVQTLGHPCVAVSALLGCAIAGRRRLLSLVLVLAALLHYGLFAPLHLAHPYYLYAIGGLLVVAVGLVAVALRECGDWRRHLAWVLLGLAAIFEVQVQLNGMIPIQQANAYRKPAWFVRIARELSARTKPDEVIVVFGMNWDPEVPYYARRRALMWPGWGDPSPEGKDVAKAVRNLAGYKIGAVVSCSRELPDATLGKFRALGGRWSEEPWRISAITIDDGNAGECAVFFRTAG